MRNITPVGWGLGAVLSLYLLACTSRPEAPGAQAEPEVVPQGAAAATQALPLTVAIEPATPTAETELIAVSNEASVAYQWAKNGRVLDGEVGPGLAKGLVAKGDEVSVTVTIDDRSASATARIANAAPRVTAIKLDPPADVYRGVDLRAIPEAVDPDGDAIVWSYQWIINGASSPFDTTALLSGDRYRRGDSVTVQVIASDGETAGEAYTPLPITIPNGPPAFTTTPTASFRSAVYEYHARAADPDGDGVRYELAGAPAGMTIDRLEGRIAWPVADQPAGTYTTEVIADDGAGGKASQTFTVTLTRQGGT